MYDSRDALAEYLVVLGIAADPLIADQLFAGHDDSLGSNCYVNVVEFIALDDAGAVRRCLLYMDDRAVKLRNGDRYDLLSGLERILHDHELVVVNGIESLALFLADPPEIDQTGARHQAYRQERKSQRSCVKLQHQDIL